MLGTLSEFNLAHLLQLFALSENSGTVTVHSGSFHTRLLVESDRVVGLGTSDFDVRLDILRIECLPARSRLAVTELVPHPDTPGLSLLVGNLIDVSRWRRYVARRFEQDVYPLLNTDDGAFEITVERCPPAPVTVSASVQQLILDCSRWEAESEALRSSGYNVDRQWTRVPVKDCDAGVSFDHTSWLVWTLLYQPTVIADVALRLGISDLEAATSVRKLHECGLVKRVP